MTKSLRFTVLIAALLVLMAMYLFQRVNFAGLLYSIIPWQWLQEPEGTFTMNRLIRMVINDVACLFLIDSIFRDARYNRVAFTVFLVELLLILPAYVVLKLTMEGPTELSVPALAQVHRMIVNPLLMFVLIVAFFYQRLRDMKTGS